MRGQRKGEYTVGSTVLCQASFDNTQRPAEIIEQKAGQDGSTSYYVHYVDCDKRLDEWVQQSRLAPFITKPMDQMDVLTPRLSTMASLNAELGGDQKLTRRLKRRYDEQNHVSQDINDLAPIDQHLEKEHQEKTKVKNIQTVEMGKYEMDTWYYSPYPEPYNSLEKLYLCEYCLKYFGKKKTLLRHSAKCDLRHPPGDEIYRSPPPGGERGQPPSSAATDPTIAVFEVDGKRNKVYCQSLCLLSKLFLDHKTLYYDVDPFLFYILCERDQQGYHIVGYFSKEKCSAEGYNLACILTLPPYQRKGYGRFLIAFSYELSKKEGKVGTPERPLSDLGQVSYRSYWQRSVLELLYNHRGQLSIKEISDRTAIRTDDIVRALEVLSLIKYWKGDHIISVTTRVIEDHLRTLDKKKVMGIDVSRLHWTPYVPANALGKK
ncbi:g6657 [Coccomyxa elongata]